MSPTREQYLQAIKAQLEPNIVNHSLAVEACMGGIYDYLKSKNQLNPNELPKQDWQLAGLIHDIDFSAELKPQHPQKTIEALAKYNLTVTPAVHHTVLAHAGEQSGVEPKSQADWAIFCADSLTGLIIAVAFVYPSRKLSDVKLSSVVKRFLKEPRFASGTRRDEISQCSQANGLNLPLETFIDICLTSMQAIASSIGL